MGASRHRRNGVHGVGSRHGAARPDRSSGGNVRRVRARASCAEPLAVAVYCCVVGLGLVGRGRFAAPPARRAGARHDSSRSVPAPSGHASDRVCSRARTRCATVRSRRTRSGVRESAPTRSRRRSRTPSCRTISRSRGGCTGRATRCSRRARSRSPICSSAFRACRRTAPGGFAAPSVGAYLGDVRRVRVFYDGFEVIAARSANAAASLDLTQINLWSAEEATIEQTAGRGSRLPAQLARATTRTPDTRTDVGTGDQQTNLYRGFFGARFDNGGAFQFGAQQYGTTPPSHLRQRAATSSGSSVRVGWAKHDVERRRVRHAQSAGTAARSSASRRSTCRATRFRRSTSTRTDAYFRVAYGDPDTSASGRRSMAVASKYDYTGIRTFAIAIAMTPAESVLVTARRSTRVGSSAQYIATGGNGARSASRERHGASLFGSAAARRSSPPSARASFATERAQRLGDSSEAKSADSIASRRRHGRSCTPLLVHRAARRASARATDDRVNDSRLHDDVSARRGGLRLHEPLVHRRRDAARQRCCSRRRASSTRCSSRSTRRTATGVDGGDSRQAVAAHQRRRLWRFGGTTRPASYRPQYQTRSELFVRTNLARPLSDATTSASWRRSFTSTGPTSASRRSSASRAVARHRVTARSPRCSRSAC